VIRLLISDLHLDPALPAGLRLFERFCLEVASGADELYVLGDLFELWVGDDADDVAARCVRGALAGVTAGGTRCHVMHGNRDFLLGNAFADACGLELIDDPTTLRIDGLAVVLAHGDALCTDDAPYQALRSQLRSEAFREDMLARPFGERTTIGTEARRRSREANELKAEHIMDVNTGAVDALLDAAGADVIVHGHTHRPGEHRWTHRGRQRRRLVLGAWDGGCVYARVDASGLALVDWP
jgi:UDP-2,3-diacylglucosamine hydrolase